MKRGRPFNTEEGFWKKVHKTKDGCWVWQGKDWEGYGAYCLHGVRWKAHRLSLRLSCVSLLEGAVVDHICRNTLCVNPQHLRQVSIEDNVMEQRSNAPSAINSRKTACVLGHPFDAENTRIKIARKNGRPTRVCRKCSNLRRSGQKKRQRVFAKLLTPLLVDMAKYAVQLK